jgi:hypothetical protein
MLEEAMLGKLWSLFSLVPSCPSRSLTSVAAMEYLVASCALKKGQARPRRRDCEVIANRAEPGKIQKLGEVCHGQTEKVYFRAVAE